MLLLLFKHRSFCSRLPLLLRSKLLLLLRCKLLLRGKLLLLLRSKLLLLWRCKLLLLLLRSKLLLLSPSEILELLHKRLSRRGWRRLGGCSCCCSGCGGGSRSCCRSCSGGRWPPGGPGLDALDPVQVALLVRTGCPGLLRLVLVEDAESILARRVFHLDQLAIGIG